MRRQPNQRSIDELSSHCALSTSKLFFLALLFATTCLQAQNTAEITGVEVRATEVDEDALRQEMPVGPYNQPEWTTQRAFSTTRVYVRPPGSFEFVQYWTPDWKDGATEHAFREELEIGL